MIGDFLDVRERLFAFGCGLLLAKLWRSIESIARCPEVIWVMVSINLIKRTWAIRTHSIMLVPHGSRLCGSYFHHFAMTEFTSAQQ